MISNFAIIIITVLCAATGVLASPVAEPKPVLQILKPVLPLAKLVPTVPKPVPPGSIPALFAPKPVLAAGKLTSAGSKPVPQSTSRQDCRSANEEFDRTLESANLEFLQRGNISVAVAGFQQYVYLSYSGASLFVKFNLKTSGGSLRLSTASRTGNAMICTECSEDGNAEGTLHGVLQLGELDLQYDKLHAEYFKSSSLDGKLSYRVRPVINVVVTRSPDSCLLDAINFVDTTSDEYQVTSDSWKDWIVGQLVSKSLRDGGDSTPILQNILYSLKQSVEAHFVKIWCNQTSTSY